MKYNLFIVGKIILELSAKIAHNTNFKNIENEWPQTTINNACSKI